jgi:hypothetical protein
MTDWSGLPEDWRVWHEADEGRVVLVFRPDVFDTQRFPAACLPTIYVSQRPPQERLPRLDAERSDWFVSLRLEPEVQVVDAGGRYESRADAVRAALGVASRFVAGEFDLRGVYQVPREAYLDELESLVG